MQGYFTFLVEKKEMYLISMILHLENYIEI